MSQKLCIFASELAIVTRHNHYQNIREYTAKLWQKNFPCDYQTHLSLYKKNNSVEIIQETPQEYLQKVASSDILKECLKSTDVETLNSNKKQLVEDIIKNKPELKPKELKKIKECVKQVTNTNFGTKHESNSLSKYNKTNNKSIKTTSKFFKASFIKTEKYQWLLGGKIDGLDTDEDSIIEFKNRVNRLFYKLRDYEKVQTMTYMFLLKKTNSRLVESLKTKTDTKMNVIEVDWDQEFWDNEVIVPTKKFINDFEILLESKEKKMELLDETFSKS